MTGPWRRKRSTNQFQVPDRNRRSCKDSGGSGFYPSETWSGIALSLGSAQGEKEYKLASSRGIDFIDKMSLDIAACPICDRNDWIIGGFSGGEVQQAGSNSSRQNTDRAQRANVIEYIGLQSTIHCFLIQPIEPFVPTSNQRS
jgi:hypothetical protein